MKELNFTALKNMIWAFAIFICIGFVAIGMLFAMFHRYVAPVTVDTGSLNGAAASEDRSSSALGSGNARGALNILEKTGDGGEEYANSIIYLVDSTFIGLREYELVGKNQVWGTSTSSLKMESLPTATIKFPNDGSEISPVSAAMVTKPAVLVIGIGTDGLTSVSENTFITNYDNLINEIKAASPNTTIVCCGLPSVIPGYVGSDGLSVGVISDGNDWIQLVCRDTGSYFLNVQEALSESVQLLNRYAASNGKQLNRSGLDTFLNYVRTHKVP
jgi:hypothetical protein